MLAIPLSTMPTPPLNFATLDLPPQGALAPTRRTIAGLVALLVLVAASALLMVVYLRGEEAKEADRRRVADSEWLDQTLRFHFRRLERELGVLAQGGPQVAASLRASPWWSEPGLVAFHGWLPAADQAEPGRWPAVLRAAAAQASHADALAVMLDTTRGLQRPAYGGPLPAADGSGGEWVWLAVPHIEQGQFRGDYLAAVPVQRAIEAFVPGWFAQEHDIGPAMGTAGLEADGRFLVPIHLPGAAWRLQVRWLGNPVPLAPRLFFGVALVCLAGMLVALIALWRDTRRRQRAEARLQTQLALRAALEQSASVGLRVWDTEGRLRHANPAFARLVGWTPDELLAQADAPPYWPADAGRELDPLRPLLQDPDGQPGGLEQTLLHRDGHRLDVLTQAAPLRLADGQVAGWVVSTLDITERRRVERLAARQQEMLEASGRLVAVGEVASTLAHELNQPLGALASFANGLLNRLRAQTIALDEIVPVVERMDRLADKAGRVIQRINAFARRQEMSRQPLALAPFVTRVAHGVPLPDGVRLVLTLPAGDGPTVPADALLLENAVHNLVLNAGEWAQQGAPGIPCVEVSLVAGEGMAGVRVADTGPGVAPDIAAHLFDAFASRKPGGMGMGLAICRSIAEAHHGRIEVEQSPRWRGAQFTLWLPLQP